MTSVIAVEEADQIATSVSNLTVQEHENLPGSGCDEMVSENHGTCAICLDKISLQDTALVKGCEHAYCAICILRWASYKENPTCPQCKHPFEFLNVHRSLDGSIKDFMFEESVCLLLRAAWFNPEIVEHNEDACNELDEIYAYEDDDGDLDDDYYNNLPNLRIGNRRWGDNGYVRAGRQEARPVHRPKPEDSGASSSRAKKEPSKSVTGRRAKRALKREAADKAAVDKHQQRLARFGR